MTSQTIVYEAEDLVLDNFMVVNGSQASGGQLVKIRGETGSLTGSMLEEGGYFTVSIFVQDENDGQSVIELLIDGQVVGSIILDQDDDGAGSNNGGFSEFTLDGIRIPQGAEIQLRAYKDGNEYVRIDKIEFTRTATLSEGDAGPAGGSAVLLEEAFSVGRNLEDSPDIVDAVRVKGKNGQAEFQGGREGKLVFATVDLTGTDGASLTLDAKIAGGSFEAWGTRDGDMLRIEIVDQDGNVHLLDMFTGWGRTLTGSITGQTITGGGLSGLSYALPQGVTAAQLRIVSDFSSCAEKIAIDNVVITAQPAGGGDPVPITVDAVDDTYRLGEDAQVADNIIANDLKGGILGAADLQVTAVSALGAENAGAGAVGQAFTVITSGGRTATVTVNADGSFTFDGGESFRDLREGQSDSFQLEYTVTADGVSDTAVVTVVIDGEGLALDAVDDAITVLESEGAGDTDGNVLDNDSLPALAAGTVVRINGEAAGIGQWVDLAGGGRVKLNADGSFDFDADGDFDALTEGQSAQVSFDYTIEAPDDAGGGLVVRFSGAGGFDARATVTEVNGSLQFDVEVLNDGGAIGDLRALFFHIADESLLPGLTISGADVTEVQTSANGVISLGNGANMNGGFGAFDVGVEFGTPGASPDDIRQTSFTLSHASQALTLDLLAGKDFGLRVTSVGPEGGARCGSLKLGGSATPVAGVLTDSATVTVTVLGESIRVDALDNAYSVGEAEDIADNIIADDLLNGLPAAPGALSVTALAVVGADGQITAPVGESFTVTTAGGRTGTVTVNADGSFTFDGGDSFLDLEDGQTDSFRLAYTVTASTQTTQTRVVDFDGPDLAAGTIVSNQIEGVTISAVRAGHSGENAAMIFDADHPTGGDWDLHQPGQGGVLIITEDFDSSDPDDNACGGTFTFTFDSPATVEQMTFLDTEEPSPLLRFYDESGNLIAEMTGPVTANGGMADMAVGVAGVKTMTVTLQGSGAIAGMTFQQTVAGETVSDTAFVDVVINGEGVDLLPVAADDLLVTDEATEASLNILANDTAGDGAIRIVAVDGGSADGTPFTLTTDDGLDASFTLQPDGTLTVTPGAGFRALGQGESRSFQIAYTIEDDDGDQSAATVTVQVNGLNEPPAAEDDAAFDTEAAAAVTGNVLANDSDPNGDAISVIAAGGQAAGTALALSATTSLGRTVGATLTVAADGSYSLVPGAGMTAMAEGETVVFSVGYRIADAWGATDDATLSVTLTGLNEAPVALDDTNRTTEAATLILGNVLANDSDPNHDGYAQDPIAVIAAGGMAPGSQIALSTTSAQGVALSGTLTVAANGAYSFTPGAGFGAMGRFDVAEFTVDYQIADSHGATATAQLKIVIDGLNDPPQATDNDYDVAESATLAGNLITDDTGAGVDSDPNGDSIHVVEVRQGGTSLGAIGDSWTVTSAGGRTGTLSVASDGSFLFTPGGDFASLNAGEKDTVQLSYVIADAHGAQSLADVTIDVIGEDGPGAGGEGGGPTINVAFVVDVSSSMMVDNLSGLPVGDINGDGVANSSFDLAYYAVSQAIANFEAAAAAAGYQLKVGLIGFDDAAIAAVNWTGDASLQAWGAGQGLVFQQGGAGDSDVNAGLAEALAWFTDIGADLSDDNQIVLLSDGQFATTGAAATIAAFQSQFGGDVHGRFNAPLEATGNWASVETLESVTTDSVTPYDPDGKFYIFDESSALYALQAADVLNFV